MLQPNLGSAFAGRLGGGKFSAKGRAFVVALREAIEALIRVGIEKNDDDKVRLRSFVRAVLSVPQIQRFLYASSQVEIDVEGAIGSSTDRPRTR